AHGSSSADSRTGARRMGAEIEEPELAALSLELRARFALQHHRDQAVPRMKDQGMERPLDTGAVGGGVLGKRKLEEGMQLHTLAAAAGILEDHATGADVAGAGESRGSRACMRGQLSLQHSQIPVAHVPTTVGHASRRIEQ